MITRAKSLRYAQALDIRDSGGAKKAQRHAPGVTNYSSGESPEAGEFEVALNDLPPSERSTRLLWLWQRTFRKALGAAMVIRRHEDQSKKVYREGMKQAANLNYSKYIEYIEEVE